MGFLIWGALTAATVAAGLSVALRVGRAFTIGEQVVAAIVTAIAVVLSVIQGLGYLDVLYPSATGVGVVLVDVLLAAALPPAPGAWREFGDRLQAAAKRSIGVVSIVVLVAAAATVLYLAAYIILLPSWGWDALWYHNPMSAYAYQLHSLGWIDTPIPFINAYPKNIELLALWNVMFAPDDRLLDGAQLPIVLMGVLALATMCRRAGASAAISLALGLCWLFVPAVLINIPSNYNDSAVAGLRFASILFLARSDTTSAHRAFGALALGAYLGSKVSAPLHAGILAVFVGYFLVRQIIASPGRRWRLALEPVVMSIVILALGSATYVRDYLRFENPIWPVRLTVLGHTFPGPWGWQYFDTPPWRGRGGLLAMWRSFQEKHGSYLADVRPGGFGPLWFYVLMPLAAGVILWVVWRWVRGRETAGAVPLVALAALSLATGASWWARHVLGFPAAGLLAAAMVLPRLRWPKMAIAATLALVAASLIQAWPAYEGFQGPPSLLLRALAMTPQERAAIRIPTWIHPGIEQRDSVMQPGDAAVYDDAATFLYLLWRYDWKSRVLYRPFRGDQNAWLQTIESDGARWAEVMRGGPAEKALRTAGWTFLGQASAERADLWMRPW